MANKNVQLKTKSGDYINPRTKASLVKNNNNENLGGVEADAQVNVIETVKVNGVALTPASKAVDVTIAADVEYSVAEVTPSSDVYVAAYQLAIDGTPSGTKVDIPKDMVVSAATVGTCTVADNPIQGLLVGDKYMDLTIANASQDHIYFSVSELMDIYTGGTGISVSNSNEVAIDNTVATRGTTLAHYGIADSMTKTAMDTAFGNMTAQELAQVSLATFTTNAQLNTIAEGLSVGDVVFVTDTNKLQTWDGSVFTPSDPAADTLYTRVDNNKTYVWANSQMNLA